ncbi:MAG TPA: hypothetical protein VHB77_20735 [Planctomycetaceae bacterium]|nr:hypothetical protein [Planctomycetaceae bacterium]
MLLGDSPQCPHCGHVLDPARAAQLFELIPAEEMRASEDEQPCPQCGEGVRVGLVRCWSCGAFMNPEMEAAYREMQASPAPIIFSQLPADAVQRNASPPADESAPIGTARFGGPAAPGGDDSDFVLGPDVSSDDNGFQLAPGVSAPAAFLPPTAPAAPQQPPAYNPAPEQPQPQYGQGYQQPYPQAPQQYPQYGQYGQYPAQPGYPGQEAYPAAGYSNDPYGQGYSPDQGYAQGYPQQYQQPQYPQGQYPQDQYAQDPYGQPGQYGQDPYAQQQYAQPEGYAMPQGYVPPETQQYAYPPGYTPADQFAQTAAYDQYPQAPVESTDQYALTQPPAEPVAESPAAPAPTAEAAPPAEAAPAPPAQAAADATGAEREPHEIPETAHSVTTGGDVLLAAAMLEEKEYEKRAKLGPGARRRIKPGANNGELGLVVYCPNGHRVQVHERHRGRAGKCPRCKALFVVPALEAPAPEAAPAPDATVAAASKTGRFIDWVRDLRLHVVNPTKLKLKPGSLTQEFETADVGFAPDEMFVATVFAGSGTFRAMQERKKKPATRDALNEHLSADLPLDLSPVSRKVVIPRDDVSLLKIAQPAPPDEESIFAGIPVFGLNRIAVRLPKPTEAGERLYLSFVLSEFRAFARLLAQAYGIENFGQELGIPLVDQFTDLKCHYTDAPLQVLENLDWYREDPGFKLVLLGRRCQGCGLIVSEDSRRKEKIGGKTPSSIAKALCPKCKKKFGDLPLYGLEQPANVPVVESTEPQPS